jgi:hypothetical protein
VPFVDFIVRYAEFELWNQARVDLALEDAENDTSSSVFGTFHARAIAALAAHRLAVSSDEDGSPVGEQPGALEQANVDGVQSVYHIPEGLSPMDAQYWATSYGQEFIRLRKRFLSGPIVAC